MNIKVLRNEKEITDVISNMSKDLNIGYQIIDCKYFNISNTCPAISILDTQVLNIGACKQHIILVTISRQKHVRQLLGYHAQAHFTVEP